jgi:hypothetical protein
MERSTTTSGSSKKKSGIKRFEPLADAMVAIRRPADIKDDDTTFVYEVEGHKYALALWSMKGVVYTAGAKKVFFTARKIGALRGGYPTYSLLHHDPAGEVSRWQRRLDSYLSPG